MLRTDKGIQQSNNSVFRVKILQNAFLKANAAHTRVNNETSGQFSFKMIQVLNIKLKANTENQQKPKQRTFLKATVRKFTQCRYVATVRQRQTELENKGFYRQSERNTANI